MANIEIPGVDFAGIAREVVAVKLTEALATSPEGIRSIVQAALGVQVQAENGQPKRYQSDVTVPWVEYVAADMIRAATKEVLQTHITAIKPQIQKAVEAALKKNTTTIAAALVDAFASEAKNGYRLGVSMSFTKRNE